MKNLLKQDLAVGACAFLALLSVKKVTADNILPTLQSEQHLYTCDHNEYDVCFKNTTDSTRRK